MLVPAKTDGGACETCDEFEKLHAAMQTADQRWDGVKHKALRSLARQSAHVAYMATHMALANFVLRAEETKRSAPAAAAEDHGGNEDSQQGAKRPRSSTSPTDPAPPPLKRSRLATGAKDVRFDDSVVFPGDGEIRDNTLYLRHGKDYVRGRHAAPEGSEWVDSSGCDQTWGKFFGLKWVGRKWIEDAAVKEEDNNETEQDADSEAKDCENPPRISRGEGLEVSELPPSTAAAEEETEREQLGEPQKLAALVKGETTGEGMRGGLSLERDEVEMKDEIVLPEHIKRDDAPGSS